MDVESSIWKNTLEEFRERILAGDSTTGAVAVSAVSASLAAGVLQMVLEIAARKREAEGHQERLRELIEAARSDAAQLAHLADEDRAAYTEYAKALRLPKTSDEERAVRRRAMDLALIKATETPLAAARSAVAAIELCVEAAGIARGAIAADIGGAAALLAGAVRAILCSVDANLGELPDQPFRQQAAAERRTLEETAVRQVEAVLRRLSEK
jgi:formiminotetrahydrofolate cyclodeaminase